MNIVFACDGYLTSYIVGMHNAAQALQHYSFIWNKKEKSAFDMAFEFKPDVVFNNIQIVEEPIIKSSKKYGFKIVAPYVDSIIEQSNEVINYKLKYGFDSINHKEGKLDPNLQCDISYVGNYNTCKKYLLKEWLKPLSAIYNIKIFGQTSWPLVNYLGYLNNDRIADLYTSSKLVLCEGDEESEKYYTICGCGGEPLLIPKIDNILLEVKTRLDMQPNETLLLRDRLKKVANNNTYIQILSNYIDNIQSIKENNV